MGLARELNVALAAVEEAKQTNADLTAQKDRVNNELRTERDNLRSRYEGEISTLREQVNRLGLEYVPTQANFFLIKTPLGARATYQRMLKEGVIVRSMESYGLPDYIRVNVGLPEENERFIKTLEKVLSS